MLATPLLRDGVAIGAVVIRRYEVREFTEQQVALLETFADQAVIAIENARLFQELQERTEQLARVVEEQRALGEVSQAVSSSLDLTEVLTTIVAHATRLADADAGTIYELDAEKRYTLVLGAESGRVDAIPGCEGLVLDLDELWAEIEEWVKGEPEEGEDEAE